MHKSLAWAGSASGLLLISYAALGALQNVPFVVGHRGLGQHHAPEPENSVAALQGAFRAGATAVEFDVQLTADQQVILAHDPRLERMTNGQGCISESGFDDLRQLRLRDGTGRVHPDLTVNTLSEALEAIRPFDHAGRAFLADIHIKVYDGFMGDRQGIDNGGCLETDFATLTDRALKTVTELGLADRVLYTSFDRRVLKRIKSAQPKARVGLLTYFRAAKAIEAAALAGFEYVAVEHTHFSQGNVERAHELGVKVLSWSPKTAEQLGWELDAGVDGWITDNVPVATGVMNAAAAEKAGRNL